MFPVPGGDRSSQKSSSTMIRILQANLDRSATACNLMEQMVKKEGLSGCSSMNSIEIEAHHHDIPIYLVLLGESYG